MNQTTPTKGTKAIMLTRGTYTIVDSEIYDFLSKDKMIESKCIRWTGAHDSGGYGRVQVGKKWRPAHRELWEASKGVLPVGMVLDHLCRVRDCINLSHLEIVTPRENTLRGFNPCAINARKQTCIRGHELMPDRGKRKCAECGRKRWRAYKARKVEAGTWNR